MSGIPLKIEANSLSDYLAVMSKAVFQAGVSWASIDSRWLEFEKVFDDFEPSKVSTFDEAKVEAIMGNSKLLKTERKVRATIKNAGTLLALDTQYSGFKNYLQSFKSYAELSKDLCAKFSHLGELSAYYFLFRVGESVPDFNTWIATIKGEHPRMREMVAVSEGKPIAGETGDSLNSVRN